MEDTASEKVRPSSWESYKLRPILGCAQVLELAWSTCSSTSPLPGPMILGNTEVLSSINKHEPSSKMTDV